MMWGDDFDDDVSGWWAVLYVGLLVIGAVLVLAGVL